MKNIIESIVEDMRIAQAIASFYQASRICIIKEIFDKLDQAFNNSYNKNSLSRLDYDDIKQEFIVLAKK